MATPPSDGSKVVMAGIALKSVAASALPALESTLIRPVPASGGTTTVTVVDVAVVGTTPPRAPYRGVLEAPKWTFVTPARFVPVSVTVLPA